MTLTLFGTGLKINWTHETGGGVAARPKGFLRLLAALEGENAARERKLAPNVTLSSAASGFSGGGDSETRESKLARRREILRRANERWLEDQKRRPGPPAMARYEQFQADLDAELAAAGVDDL